MAEGLAPVLPLERTLGPRDALIRLNRLAAAIEARNAVIAERLKSAAGRGPVWVALLREAARNDQTLARLAEQRLAIVERTVVRG
jgi:hypothetical protein